MPIAGRNYEVYTPKWIGGLKKIPEYTFTAMIEFWDRASETVEYKPETNRYEVEYTPSLPAPIPCRIQPMRSAVQRFTAVDGTWAQHYLISMSYDHRFDIQAGSRAKIVHTSNNPNLKAEFFTVKEISDSDNSIEFTILCEVDTEIVEKS